MTPGRPRQRRAQAWARWWCTQVSDEVTRVAARQAYVLSVGQLAELAVTRSARRHAVAVGRWYQPMRGFVAVVDVEAGTTEPSTVARRRHALDTVAAVLSRPGLVASGRSAAILHGLPTVRVPETPELTLPQALERGVRNRAHVFPAGLAREDLTTWLGVPVVTVERAVVDLARHDRRDGIMAADAALHERLARRSDLDAALDRARGWPGVQQAREIIGLADAGAESPLESVLRLAMHDDGFPAPELQFGVNGFWADLALPDHGLLIEADGRGKYEGQEWLREKARDEVMRRPGWWTERVMSADVYRRWAITSARLRRSMRPGFAELPRWS